MPSEAINAFMTVHSLKPSDSRQSDAPTRRTFTFTAAGVARPPLATRRANQISSDNYQIFQSAQNINEDVPATHILDNLPRLFTPSANRSVEPPQAFDAQKQSGPFMASSMPPPDPAPEVKGKRRTFGNLETTHGSTHLTSSHTMTSTSPVFLVPPRPDFATPAAKVRPGLVGLGIVNEGDDDRGSLTALTNRNPALRHALAPAYTPIRELSRDRHSTPVHGQSLNVDANGGDGVDEDGTISIKVFNAMLATNKEKDRKLRIKVNTAQPPSYKVS
jgi:hypothetical protein